MDLSFDKVTLDDVQKAQDNNEATAEANVARNTRGKADRSVSDGDLWSQTMN